MTSSEYHMYTVGLQWFTKRALARMEREELCLRKLTQQLKRASSLAGRAAYLSKNQRVPAASQAGLVTTSPKCGSLAERKTLADCVSLHRALCVP